jgi:eukaryotic-like serine/threonine-protein kinase
MGLPASVPPPPPVKPGDVVAGKYLVDREIASGGMGVLYAAKHMQLDQEVALKFMRTELRGQISTSRFTAEARATAKLRSAHIARVFDVGVLEDGTPFMVMELLSGIDLEHLLAERGPLISTVAAELVTQACEAVSEAHTAGIVHRDLKPANLFLTKTPQGAPFVKVLDFGISKAMIEAGPSATAAGTIMGSPPYMSPESLKSSKNANARSDIWALGVILYELVTGQLPFEGEGVGELALKVHYEEPLWPTAIDPEIPREYEDIVRTCLKKNPHERYGSVEELREALVRFTAASSTGGVTLSLSTSQPQIVIVVEDSPNTPRTAERMRRAREAPTMVPLTATEHDELQRATERRKMLRRFGAVGGAVGVAIATAAIVMVLTNNDHTPQKATSEPALGTSLAAAPTTTGSAASSSATPTSNVSGVPPVASVATAPESSAPVVTSAGTRPTAVGRPTPGATTKSSTAKDPSPTPPPSLTPPPAAAQPSPASSTGRALRDRGF